MSFQITKDVSARRPLRAHLGLGAMQSRRQGKAYCTTSIIDPLDTRLLQPWREILLFWHPLPPSLPFRPSPEMEAVGVDAQYWINSSNGRSKRSGLPTCPLSRRRSPNACSSTILSVPSGAEHDKLMALIATTRGGASKRRQRRDRRNDVSCRETLRTADGAGRAIWILEFGDAAILKHSLGLPVTSGCQACDFSIVPLDCPRALSARVGFHLFTWFRCALILFIERFHRSQNRRPDPEPAVNPIS